MISLKILLILAVILAAGVGAYIAYAPYRTNEDEVFELNLKALADGKGGESSGQGEEGSIPDCYSGGPGSTACSINANTTILGVGVAAGCSVTCGSDTYDKKTHKPVGS